MNLKFHNQKTEEYIRKLSRKGFLYLGMPYSSKSKEVMEWRYEKSAEFGAMFHEAGMMWFSPVSMSHTAAKYMSDEVSTDWNAWKDLDLKYANVCSALIVCGLNGWQQSTGLRAEIEYFEKQGKPIFYLDEDSGAVSLMTRENCIQKILWRVFG